MMFTDILKTFSEFFVVFAFFVLAFSLSFTILLGNQVCGHIYCAVLALDKAHFSQKMQEFDQLFTMFHHALLFNLDLIKLICLYTT